LGIELFDLLEKIHSIRIIHGDIHGSNIAFRNDKLVLIDFGRGTIGPDDMDIGIHEEVLPTTANLKCHPSVSLWETVRIQPALSYRDDAFRAALVLGLMVHGPQHRLARKNLCGDSSRAYHEYLQSRNVLDGSVFVRSKRYDLLLSKVLPTMDSTEHKAISEHFAEMLRHIRELAYGEVPDYNRVKAELIAIQRILMSRD
jgi:serine/threonine protein kinase